MVGRPVLFQVQKPPTQTGEVVLQIENVQAINDKKLPALKNLSLNVRKGEIVGVAGVAGNGQRELAETIIGLRHANCCRILIKHTDVTTHNTGTSTRVLAKYRKIAWAWDLLAIWPLATTLF